MPGSIDAVLRKIELKKDSPDSVRDSVSLVFDSSNQADFFGTPWKGNYPFKPYANPSEFVGGVGQIVLAASAALSASVGLLAVSGLTAAGALLGLASLPISMVAMGLLSAANYQAEAGEGVVSRLTHSVGAGISEAGATLSMALMVDGIAALISAACFLLSAASLLLAVAIPVVGVSMQASRLVGSAAYYPVSSIHSLFAGGGKEKNVTPVEESNDGVVPAAS